MSLWGRQPGQPRYSGQLHNLQVTESVFGTTLPIVIGTSRVHGKLLDYNGFTATQTSSGGGKGIFGGKGDITEYSANVVIALAQGPCQGILSIWDQQGKLANYSGSTSYTVPSGGGSITPQTNPPIQNIGGGVYANVPYSVTADDYGSTGPTSFTGIQQIPMTSVATPTTAYEYNFNNGTYTFPAAAAGLSVTITYSSVFSLYYFAQTQAAEIPLGAPYQVSTDNQAYFQANNGVVFVDTGEALTLVSGAPTASGTYSEDVGFYSFAPADAGRYVYINYVYYSSDSTLTTSSALNLSVFNGNQSQQPWNFLVSNYPGSAFGYSGICYAGAAPLAMGESPTLPSYNYELAGLALAPASADADLTVAMQLLACAPLYGINFPSAAIGDWSLAQAYLGANGFFISDCLTTQQSISDTFTTWLEAANVAAVWSGSKLNLIPYGDRTCVGNGYTYTPPGLAATLSVDDLLPFSDKNTGENTDEDPIQVERTAARDAYNYMQVEWINRANDYNVELTPEQNDAFIKAYGLRMEGPQSWHFITSQSGASWALNLRLKRALYKRNTYKFNLGWNWSMLEPMDIIELPTGEPVRITEIEDDENGKLTLTAEQFTYGSGSATIYPKQAPNSYQPNVSQAVPGDTSAYIFEASPQSVLAQPNTVQIAVAGQTPNWGGCVAYVSSDGTTYTQLDKLFSTGRGGLLSAALAAGSDPDTADTLSVDMTLSNGELVSATQAEADSFVTLCAIVDGAGTMELLSYETASLTGKNRYSLSYLRRGVYGTTIGAHAIGAEFAYIGTSGVYEYQYPAQYVGRTLYFKFASFNLVQGQQQDLSTCKVYQFTIPGTTLQPPSSGTFTTSPLNPLNTYTVSSSVAYITVSPFTALLNNLRAACLTAGVFTSGALAPNQLYYVYYVDPAFLGGAITPQFTQNQLDYLGKTGYYFLGSVTTQPAGGSGAGPWYPSSYIDSGGGATSNPTAPYSQNPNEYASLVGSGGVAVYSDVCTWLAFPDTTPTGEMVYVTLSGGLNTANYPPSTPYSLLLVDVSFDSGSTWTNLLTVSTESITEGDEGSLLYPKTTLTLAVPSGTDLDSIQVRVSAQINNTFSAVGAQVFDIHVQ
jgi:hypothetical protein